MKTINMSSDDSNMFVNLRSIKFFKIIIIMSCDNQFNLDYVVCTTLKKQNHLYTQVERS